MLHSRSKKWNSFIKGFFCISKSWQAGQCLLHSFHEDPLQAWCHAVQANGDAVNGIQRATKESRIPLFWYLKYYVLWYEPRARAGLICINGLTRRRRLEKFYLIGMHYKLSSWWRRRHFQESASSQMNYEWRVKHWKVNTFTFRLESSGSL